MLNRKWILVIAVALFSSYAFAETPANDDKQVEIFCRFDGPSMAIWNARSGLECEVEARVKIEHLVAGVTDNEMGRDEQFRVRCNGDFEIRDDDPAVKLSGDELFINAKQRQMIATLDIERFSKGRDNDDRRREAILLLGDRAGNSANLKSVCEIRERRPD